MRVLGIDPGYAIVGWGVVDYTAPRFEAVDYGAVTTPAGLPLSRLLYNRLITTNFPYYTWSIPVPALLIILLFVIGATITSVHAPAKRIRGMSITDTINEL